MKRKSKSKPDPCGLTLRQIFDDFYDRSELAPFTIKRYGNDITRFEKQTTNPPIGRITDETMADFKRNALTAGMSPATVNIALRTIRAVLRRVGPRETGNPGAKGFLPMVPYVRPCRALQSIPRRLDLDAEISRFYIACAKTRAPHFGFPPAFFWQALVVWLYCTGMRIGDALRVRFDDISLRQTVCFTARKTMRAAEIPVHPVALAHVERIRSDRELIFYCPSTRRAGGFWATWKRICELAKIEPFSPHDLRKTAASEINRAASEKRLPPLAGVLLQHAARSVTDVHYTNQTAELAEALAAMRMPIAFVQGPREAERQLNRSREEAAKAMRAAQLAPATFPDVSEWDLSSPFGFSIRGEYVPMRGAARSIIEALATSPKQRCDLETLAQAVWPAGDRPKTDRLLKGRISDSITTCRERLRLALHLPPAWDPCPCIERGRGGTWTLFIPAATRRQGGAA